MRCEHSQVCGNVSTGLWLGIHAVSSTASGPELVIRHCASVSLPLYLSAGDRIAPASQVRSIGQAKPALAQSGKHL